jgi:hypothetical protein
MIRNTPRQDIGSHTFSHYFCLEEGETKESFEADLDAAQRIASGTMGIKLRSLALPRNQLKREYVPLIRKAGFLCYRGCQTGKIHEPRSTKVARATHFRVARFLDDYFPVSCDCTPAWKDLETDQPGLYDVRASRFLREPPLFVGPTNRLRAQRIKKVMRIAAQAHLIYHLWWHPHNFGAYVDESIEFLSDILSEFCELRDRFGFRSMSMVDAASLVQDLKAHALVPAGA